jgi:hypothetical protein
MLWLKIIGWFLFILPILGFIGFTIWMIHEVMREDAHIKTFIGVLGLAWIIGVVMLVFAYMPDFMILFGFAE